MMAEQSPTTPAGKPAVPRSPRRRAREFVLQGLYQWRVSGNDEAAIEAHLRDIDDFDKADREFFVGLLRGVLAQRQILEGKTASYLDRPFNELSTDRSLRFAGRCFRVEQLPANAVSGDHQRVDRAGQRLRWNRRPQVRERRPRQTRCRLASGRGRSQADGACQRAVKWRVDTRNTRPGSSDAQRI
jgi:hypothetical protein